MIAGERVAERKRERDKVSETERGIERSEDR